MADKMASMTSEGSTSDDPGGPRMTLDPDDLE